MGHLSGASTGPAVDASIDRSTLVAQGPSGQDERYGRGLVSGKRLIHEIRRSPVDRGRHVHSLSTARWRTAEQAPATLC